MCFSHSWDCGEMACSVCVCVCVRARACVVGGGVGENDRRETYQIVCS